MTYVYGLGVGPLVAFDPAPPAYIPTGFANGGTINAIDAAGNLYVATIAQYQTVEKSWQPMATRRSRRSTSPYSLNS
jgi:hypothetical protein